MAINVKTRLISILLALLMLSSCAVREADTAPSTDGVGRQTASVSSDSADVTEGSAHKSTDAVSDPSTDEEASEPVTEDEPDDPALEVMGTPGQYNVPTDLSFLDNVPKGHFSDKNPDDPNGCWYPGRFVRNLATGEVEVKWDRAADTLALVDKYEAIYRGDETKKYVYLTFDCGYEYVTDAYPKGVTSDILDTLKEKGVRGTFFVTGDYLKGTQGERELIQRMLDEGHIVGTHTLSHYNMTTVTPEKFVEEIKANNDLFKSMFPDAPNMVFYRPPEGGACEWTLALARAMGLYTCFWSATEADYNTAAQPDPATTLTNDKVKLHNGGVYLLHAVSTTNAQILGDLIDYIHAEGYEIRGLDEFVR